MNISRAVEHIVNRHPQLQEMLARGLANYAAVADHLLPEVERETGKKPNLPAVMMALRRLADRLQEHDTTRFDFSSEIIMKSPLCDIAVERSPELAALLKTLYDAIDLEQGDTLHIIHGNYEMSIVTNEKHRKRVLKHLKGLKIINIEGNLVALSLRFSSEFWETPGVIARVLREFAWKSINIFEIVSTFTELSLIINEKDTTQGYNVLTGLVKGEIKKG